MLADQMPVPPAGMVMTSVYPEMLASNLVVLALILIWMLRDAIKNNTLIPVTIMIGATVATLTECIWDTLDAVWYAQYGQAPLYRMFNISVPTWMLAAYPCYIGGLGYWLYRRFNAGFTWAQLWVFYFFAWAANCILEMPVLHLGGVNTGVYVYYGAQPFEILGFPLWQAMGNALMPMLAAAMLYAFRNIFTGLRSLLVIPAVPMAVALALSGVGWPTMLALHSGYGYVATYPAAIISFGFSCLITYLVGEAVCQSAKVADKKLVGSYKPSVIS